MFRFGGLYFEYFFYLFELGSYCFGVEVVQFVGLLVGQYFFWCMYVGVGIDGGGVVYVVVYWYWNYCVVGGVVVVQCLVQFWNYFGEVFVEMGLVVILVFFYDYYGQVVVG